MADISEWPKNRRIELYEIIDELDGWGLVVTDAELLLEGLGLTAEDVQTGADILDTFESA
jgi:hypothetical protein